MSAPPGGVGEAELAAYLESLRREFPRFRLRYKRDDGLSRLIARLLWLVTLGAQRHYVSHYVTTLGQGVYLPDDWDQRSPLARYLVMRHEAVHLRQFRRLGFPLMAVLYTLPFLPLGLAYGRARLEWEAYAETIRATAERLGPDAVRDPTFQGHIVRSFTSGAYGWMWPFPGAVHRWIARELAALE